MATHAETQRGLNLAKTRDWLAIAAAVAVVVGALATGIQWAVSSAVAPLITEVRSLRSEVHGLQNRMGRMDKHMDRVEDQLGILPELRERLTRVETILLERGGGVP